MMNISKGLTALLLVIGAIGFTRSAFGQDPGCSSPPCSPNPVPCAHCTGTWTDDYSAAWAVSSNNNPPSYGYYSVSGRVVVPHPADPEYGCPNVTYVVTGSISHTFGSAWQRGMTAFQWVASNPSPSGSCGGRTPVASLTYNGTILNNGCDFASGSWTSSSSGSGLFSMTKPPDFPDGSPTETNVAVAWWSIWPTVLLFEPTIGASKSFAGRQVFESPNGSPSDSCYFPDAAAEPFHLTGAGWFVGFYFFDNRWHYDYVGFSPALIAYYRAHNRTPCLATAPQAMKLYTLDTLGSQTYFTNTLYVNLPDDTWVGIARDGVQGWRTWP